MRDQNIRVNVNLEAKAWLKTQADKRQCSVSLIVLELVLAAMAKSAETK